MVDYRGPEFLRSFCSRHQIDIFDRVVDLEFVEFDQVQIENVNQLKCLNKVVWSDGYKKPSEIANLRKIEQKFPQHFRVYTNRKQANLFDSRFVLLFKSQPAEQTALPGEAVLLAEYQRLLKEQEKALAEQQSELSAPGFVEIGRSLLILE